MRGLHKKEPTDDPQESASPPVTKKKKPTKKYRLNTVSYLLWGFIFLFVVTGIVSIYNGIQAKNEVKSAHKQIEQLEKNVASLQVMSTIDTPETDSLFRRFINLYFTVSKEVPKQEERQSKLAEFNNKLDYKLPSSPKVGQTVYSVRNYGYQEIDDYFLVTYTIETRTDEKEPKSFVSNVSIPFKKDKGKYTILALPYQQEYDPNALVGKSNDTLESYKGEELEDKKAQEAIKNFSEQFLTEYQANNKENLKYLMKDVEGLNANKVIELKKIRYFGTTEKPVVELALTIENKDTGISFNENMRLFLVKNSEGKYSIDTLEHY